MTCTSSIADLWETRWCPVHPGEVHVIVPVLLQFPCQVQVYQSYQHVQGAMVSIFLAGSHLAAFQPSQHPSMSVPAVHEQSRMLQGVPVQ